MELSTSSKIHLHERWCLGDPNGLRGHFAERIISNSENITPEILSAIVKLFIDVSVSGAKGEREECIALILNAINKSAERIVVLESLLESERKLRQADRDFALKNSPYL